MLDPVGGPCPTSPRFFTCAWRRKRTSPCIDFQEVLARCERSTQTASGTASRAEFPSPCCALPTSSSARTVKCPTPPSLNCARRNSLSQLRSDSHLQEPRCQGRDPRTRLSLCDRTRSTSGPAGAAMHRFNLPLSKVSRAKAIKVEHTRTQTLRSCVAFGSAGN